MKVPEFTVSELVEFSRRLPAPGPDQPYARAYAPGRSRPEVLDGRYDPTVVEDDIVELEAVRYYNPRSPRIRYRWKIVTPIKVVLDRP